jgi:hypothetical protein
LARSLGGGRRGNTGGRIGKSYKDRSRNLRRRILFGGFFWIRDDDFI